MKTRLLLAWLSLCLAAAGARCAAPGASPSPGVGTTGSPPAGLSPTAPAVDRAATRTAQAAAPAPAPSRTAAPTPTLVPPPRDCLLEPFADDVVRCGAIPDYDIDLTIDPPAAQVRGRQVVRYPNQESEPLQSLYVRLFPNSPTYGGVMTVTQVTLSGRPAIPTLELERTALYLPLSPPLAVGEALTLTLEFTVDVPTTGRAGHGLFAYRRGIMTLPNVYPLIAVHDGDGWQVDLAPQHSDDVYSEVAAYRVRITAPADMTLVASGVCAQEEAEGAEATWRCEAAPMRDFMLVVGRDYRQRNRLEGGVVVNSYFYAGHERGGERALQTAADALRVFADLFGPYPYSELDVVETPNYLGGMEYPGLVVVQDSLYPGVTGVEWLTAHEVAHQWWFGLVGSDQVTHPWLDEALTQYSTMLYYERAYSAERAARIRYVEFEQVHQGLIRRGRDLPIGLPADEYAPGLYWDVVYDKGALYFHALRERTGDDAFFRILRTYYERHRYGIATPETFLDAVETVTGDRHMDLFAEWVLGDPTDR